MEPLLSADLSHDDIINIVKYLNYDEISNLISANKSWQKVASQKKFWQRLIIQRFPNKRYHKNYEGTPKEFFRFLSYYHLTLKASTRPRAKRIVCHTEEAVAGVILAYKIVEILLPEFPERRISMSGMSPGAVPLNIEDIYQRYTCISPMADPIIRSTGKPILRLKCKGISLTTHMYVLNSSLEMRKNMQIVMDYYRLSLRGELLTLGDKGNIITQKVDMCC
jgi:hypothetical protein